MTREAEIVKAMIEKLTMMGTVDPDLLAMLDRAREDPALLQLLMKELEAAGGPNMEPALDIASFYREGDGRRYEQRWPLSGANPAASSGIAFTDMDRKTQFFVLFAECQRRETEGMLALTQGNLEDAETAFNECLQRAAQIDVGELRARACEDLARIAERRGQAERVAQLLDEAEQARAHAA